jgi:regulator of protease activity HflC (stomatin/prohibitin superfamily)
MTKFGKTHTEIEKNLRDEKDGVITKFLRQKIKEKAEADAAAAKTKAEADAKTKAAADARKNDPTNLTSPKYMIDTESL